MGESLIKKHLNGKCSVRMLIIYPSEVGVRTATSGGILAYSPVSVSHRGYIRKGGARHSPA